MYVIYVYETGPRCILIVITVLKKYNCIHKDIPWHQNQRFYLYLFRFAGFNVWTCFKHMWTLTWTMRGQRWMDHNVHPSSLALRHEYDVCNDYRSNSYWTLCVTVRHFMSNVLRVNNCVLRVRKYKIVVVNVLCRR